MNPTESAVPETIPDASVDSNETVASPPPVPAPSKRVFSVKESSVDIKGGRYHSKVVTQAAQKAAKQLFRKADDSMTEITFTLREMKRRTKGASPRTKTYSFSATKQKRDVPLRIDLDGKEILIENDFVVKAIKPTPVAESDPIGTETPENEETLA